MKDSIITTIKDGKVVLPKELGKAWKDAEIYVRFSGDTAILKKVYKPGKLFDPAMVKKLKALGKKISQKEINDAVKWARSQTYNDK